MHLSLVGNGTLPFGQYGNVSIETAGVLQCMLKCSSFLDRSWQLREICYNVTVNSTSPLQEMVRRCKASCGYASEGQRYRSTLPERCQFYPSLRPCTRKNSVPANLTWCTDMCEIWHTRSHVTEVRSFQNWLHGFFTGPFLLSISVLFLVSFFCYFLFFGPYGVLYRLSLALSARIISCWLWNEPLWITAILPICSDSYSPSIFIFCI